MNIFISENESKEKVFDELTHTLDIQKFKDEISDIFKKVNNNYVGYYLFEDKKQYYKIFVLPKHIYKPKNDGENIEVIKQFVEYLKIHYKLKVKYDEYEPNSLNLKSSFELAFDSLEDTLFAQDIEQFIFYKYQSLLSDILKFFDTHKAHKRIKKGYISQTIKYNLNLAKNIKESNKTKIHQDKIEEIIFSQIATITFGVMKLFNRSKLNLIKEQKLQNDLHQLSSRIKNILQQKYQIEKGFDLTINKLLSSQNFKYFRKKKDSLSLYVNLLSLFGIENFYDEKENKQLDRSISSESLFFRPEKLYEWIVYDYLKEQYKNYEIYKDKLEIGTTKKYKINDSEIKSEPDIILKDISNNILYIIDAKWKLLNKDNPDIDDILKLKRDSKVRSTSVKNIYSLLIYPKCDNKLYNEYLINESSKATFKFYAKQITISDFPQDILFDVTEVSISNEIQTNLNKRISQINKNDYKNESDDISAIFQEIESYIITNFDEETIFRDYRIVKEFIYSDLEKSENMKKLIKSSISVLYYLDNFVEEGHSDYTLPASSIWKAIESEIKENIRSLIKNIKKNELGEKLYNDSITLGTYSFVFRNIVNYKSYSGLRNVTYTIFKDILSKLDKNMEEYKRFFEIITDMRNDYTHNEIMTKENFYEDVLNGIFTRDVCSLVIMEDIVKFNIEMKKNLEML